MSAQKILIIDNDVSVCMAAKMTLADKYDVATTTRASGAFKYLTNNNVDLILLDINMPQINGIEALQEIKKIQPEVDVIMITAHASEENITAAKALGVHGFVVKPFDVSELRNYVDGILFRKIDCE